MTKSQIAQKLYDDRVQNGQDVSRKSLMDLFTTHPELMMTSAGASTYASNVKKSTGDVIKSVKLPKTEKSTKTVHSTPEVEKSTDSRQLYSKVYFKGDDIEFISCHYDKNDCISFTPQNKQIIKQTKNLLSICVKGVPLDSETVSQVKSKYTLISL